MTQAALAAPKRSFLTGSRRTKAETSLLVGSFVPLGLHHIRDGRGKAFDPKITIAFSAQNSLISAVNPRSLL